MAYQTNIPVELAVTPTPDFSVSIKAPDKKTIQVLQFQKEDGTWYVRFSPKKEGVYTYTHEKQTKEFVVTKYAGDNPLYRNGGITAQKNTSYLTYENGKPFFWLADTWWYGATSRMDWPQPFKTIVSDRKEKGFTVVQIVVGIPPEIDAFSKDCENSGGGPFQKDWSINPGYFTQVDTKIAYLVAQGIVPCIVGGWGHHIDWMGEENMQRFWKEIIARYSAYPVVFCLSGEIDIHLGSTMLHSLGMGSINHGAKKTLATMSPKVFSLLKKMKHTVLSKLTATQQNNLLRKRVQAWNRIGSFIQEINVFDRPMTAHISRKNTAAEVFGNPSWLNINSFQSGHSLDGFPFMVQAVKHHNDGVIINMEPWYEGILHTFDAYYQRVAFWACVLSGAKGHSYGAHGLWQMAQKADGFMQHWGTAFWKDALIFPGAKHLGIGKHILEKYNWWQLVPDKNIVTPQCDGNSFAGAFCGRIQNNVYIIYIPKQHGDKPVTLTLPSGSYTLSIFSPIDGKIIETHVITGKTVLPQIATLIDVLYIAEKA